MIFWILIYGSAVFVRLLILDNVSLAGVLITKLKKELQLSR